MEFLLFISVLLNVYFFVSLWILKSEIPHDGQIVVSTEETGKKIFSLEFDGDPYEDLENKEYVTFKIIPVDIVDNV
jgi:hypothetical protein